jgi:hypothetical protein
VTEFEHGPARLTQQNLEIDPVDLRYEVYK